MEADEHDDAEGVVCVVRHGEGKGSFEALVYPLAGPRRRKVECDGGPNDAWWRVKTGDAMTLIVGGMTIKYGKGREEGARTEVMTTAMDVTGYW